MVDRRDLAEDRAGPEIAEDDLVPVGRIELGPDMTLEDHIDFGAARAEAEDGLAGAGIDEARVRLKLAPERIGQHQSQRRKLGYPVQGRVSTPNIPRPDYRAQNNTRTRRGPPKAPDAAVYIAISRPIVYVTPATSRNKTAF